MTLLLKVSPGGSAQLTVYRYGGVPPAGVRSMVTGVPDVAVVAPLPGTMRGAGAMVMVKPLLGLLPSGSVARTVKLNVPALEGVPKINPFDVRERPSGRLPLDSANVTGPPPLPTPMVA